MEQFQFYIHLSEIGLESPKQHLNSDLTNEKKIVIETEN